MNKRLSFLFLTSLLFGLVSIGGFVVVQHSLLAVQPAQAAIDAFGDNLAPGIGQNALNSIGLGNRDPRVIAARLVQVFLGLLGVIAVILLLYAGYLWMTAAGDADKIDRAKKIMSNAAIGLLIILAAFALVSFIISRLLFAINQQYIKDHGGNGNLNLGPGIGAIGAGIIESVYPVPGQVDVPRNTSVIVTFKVPMDPTTICDKMAGDLCAPDAKILTSAIKIFKTKEGSSDQTNLSDVKAASKDNKTFIFTPQSYLGSPSENISYSVRLTNSIKKGDGQVGLTNGFEWSFTVSNNLDLTPPQITSVFPGPDNAQDTIGSTVPAVQATAAIIVSGQPATTRQASVGYTKTNPQSVDITMLNADKNTCDGVVNIAINATTPLSANIDYTQPGLIDTPAAGIVDGQIDLACHLAIRLGSNFSAGHSWQLQLATFRQSDFILLGSDRYSFVSGAPQDFEISVNADPNQQAANIAKALNTNPLVSAAAVGNKVNLRAATAGLDGNSITLQTTNNTVLSVTPFGGGDDSKIIRKVADKPDKPKNAVIQINFNEAINPLTAAGTSDELKNYLGVYDGNNLVAGKFVMSNLYRTVEFIPDQECGINGCGQKVYCLPPNANLYVKLTAATLSATCAGDSDCQRYTPYNNCIAGICYDTNAKLNYPAGVPGSGISDLANNSLDGNRNSNAQGPVNFYYENQPSANGDNYQWSFWISDQMDLTPPLIVSTNISHNQKGVQLDQLVTAQFNKLLLASSLTTSSRQIKNGDQTVTHKLINLWSVAKAPIGFWISKVDQDTSNPPDKEPDTTQVQINHARFEDSNAYRAQIGSGIQDIYQNCYKPCASVTCPANNSQPSCCGEQPAVCPEGGNCP